MLEQEIAALVHFLEPLKLKHYFGELPKGFATPSVYFPPPEIDGDQFSVSTYENLFTVYIKVFDRTSMDSFNLASKIVKSIQSRRKRIPLYDEKGKLTGKNFLIIKLNARNIDTGVTQIHISWKTHTAYDEETYIKAARFFYEGLPVSRKE